MTVLFGFLILRGDKKPEDAEQIQDAARVDDVSDGSTETDETEPGLGSHPDINTDTGTNEKHITPGGIEYSFIDTTGMTPEEIEELETRLDAEATYTYEPTTNLGGEKTTAGMYKNTSLSCTFPNGSVLRIGTDDGDGNALYLNPVYEAVEEENIFSAEKTAFAFYVKTMFGEDVATATSATALYNQGSNVGYKYFVIKDRTYDTLVPAEYIDSVNYGVKWTDLNNLHGFDGSDYDIAIRVVRLPDGQLMGTAKMQVAFDPTAYTYSIVNLVCSDVSVTGELTEEARNEIVDRAFEFFCSDDKGQSTFIDQSYWDTYKAKTIVEKVDWFYFPRLFDAQGNTVSAGKFSGISTYAVNINYPGYGFATIYCAAQQQINGMRDSAPDIEDLRPFAFDAFKPFDKTTLFVPAYQEQAFYN